MQRNTVHIFSAFAGGLSLALAAAFLIANISSLGLSQPPEPILKIPVGKILWIAAGVFLGAACICIMAKASWLKLSLVFWLGLNFFAYEYALRFSGIDHGLKGYLGSLSSAFGVSVNTTNLILNATFLFMLLGSIGVFFNLWLESRQIVKIACPQCDGHIAFHRREIGRYLPCPHCKHNITLQRPAQSTA